MELTQSKIHVDYNKAQYEMHCDSGRFSFRDCEKSVEYDPGKDISNDGEERTYL